MSNCALIAFKIALKWILVEMSDFAIFNSNLQITTSFEHFVANLKSFLGVPHLPYLAIKLATNVKVDSKVRWVKLT